MTLAERSHKWRAEHPGWRDKHREEIRIKDGNYYHRNRTKILDKLRKKRAGNDIY